MSTKEEIIAIVEQLDDEKQIQLLQQIKELISPKLDPILKAKLIARADRSEEDIKAGRVRTIEEARKILNKSLGL